MRKADYAKMPVYLLWAERPTTRGSIPGSSVYIFSGSLLECQDNIFKQAMTTSANISTSVIVIYAMVVQLSIATSSQVLMQVRRRTW